MLENQQNKMQKRDIIKDEKVLEQEFFFPQLGVTIKALSLVEAQIKAKKIVEDNFNKTNNTINK